MYIIHPPGQVSYSCKTAADAVATVKQFAEEFDFGALDPVKLASIGAMREDYDYAWFCVLPRNGERFCPSITVRYFTPEYERRHGYTVSTRIQVVDVCREAGCRCDDTRGVIVYDGYDECAALEAAKTMTRYPDPEIVRL